MKSPFLFAAALLLLSLMPFAESNAQMFEGAQPGWQAFEEAVVSASEADKKVMVFVYAPWCGWCRKLNAEVHADEAVRAYLDAHYISTPLNGDDGEATTTFKGYTLTPQELATGLGTESFPTTVFLDAESTYITRLPGFLGPEEFLRVLQYVHTDAYLDQSYEDFLKEQGVPVEEGE